MENVEYLLNYGVLGFFSIIMLTVLAVVFKMFKELFNEYRKRLEECNSSFTKDMKEIKANVCDITQQLKQHLHNKE
jgi:uncharacterized membrane protein YkvI